MCYANPISLPPSSPSPSPLFLFPSSFFSLSLSEDAIEDDLKLLVAEMEQLASLGQHPNIVSLVRVCTVGSEWTLPPALLNSRVVHLKLCFSHPSLPEPLYMVMEYMCYGDLLGFLRCSRGHQSMFTISPGIGNHPPCLRLSSRDLINIATKIANGMRYLADRKVSIVCN